MAFPVFVLLELPKEAEEVFVKAKVDLLKDVLFIFPE